MKYTSFWSSWIAFIGATILLVVVLCFQLYLLYGLIKLGFKHSITIKRYHNLSLTTAIGCTLSSLGMFGRLINQSTISDIFNYPSGYVSLLGAIIAQYAIAFRFWMIYYQSHFNKLSKLRHWQLLINPNISQINKTMKKSDLWFLKHKHNFGNYNFLKKRVFWLFLILTIPEMILYSLLYVAISLIELCFFSLMCCDSFELTLLLL